MADREDNTSMYCHVCHHTWTRDGDCIQCPQCTSSSTEMITPEHDPRLFHNRPQEQPATPMDVDTPVDTTPADAPSAPMDTTDQGEQQTSDQGSETTSSNNDNSSSNNDHNNDNSNAHARGSQPIRFTAISFPTGVTLITTVIGDQPPPPILMPGPVPVPFFGWHFMHPPRHSPSPAEDNGASQQPQAENAQSDTQQQQSENSQQQPAESQPATTGTQPQPATGNPQPSRQAQMVDAILTMLLNPAAAIMGDAVYSQEAFDRVMTMLRSQMPTGGAPPASQAAIEKLVVKELDEKMLGTEGTSKCVVCVEDMVIGEKATFLPCNHFFHGECVTPWLKEHNTCPVCRRSVEQEETVKSKIVEFGPERPSQMMQHSDHGQDSMDCS